MTEITKELFNTIVTKEDINTKVVNAEHYRDEYYFKHGVTLMYRTQNGYTNYYIQDINK